VWQHRIMLESLLHVNNSFVTLTYADDVKELSLSDCQLWLKRLRKAFAPLKLRYFITGEYGEKLGRPHYHAALFGYPSCQLKGSGKGECKCEPCSIIRKTWGHGHVMVGTLERRSAAYVAGYVMKKRRTSGVRGREFFSKMSLRPGLGAGAMEAVAQSMQKYGVSSLPRGLRHGGVVLPLGRYLVKRLQERTNAPEDSVQKDRFAKQLRMVRAYAWSHEVSVAQVFLELNEEYERALLARERVARFIKGSQL
jgi:hypothetical protein